MMKMTQRLPQLHTRYIVLIVVLLCSLFLVSCDHSDDESKDAYTTSLSNRLFMASGQTGTLEPTGTANEYRLTLNNVLPEVNWISDRPNRETGIESTSHFIQEIWPELFDDIYPNVVVKFVLNDEHAGVFLALRNPDYQEDSGTLSFTAELISSTFEDNDTRLQENMAFETPSLVVLNNNSGMNFVVYGKTATIKKSTDKNTFTLSLQKLDDEVLWAASGPIIGYSVSQTQDIENEWDSYFSNDPPNAFILGVTDSGESKTFEVTMSNMEYSDEDNSVSYEVSFLGDAPTRELNLYFVTLVIDGVNIVNQSVITESGSRGFKPLTVNRQPISGISLEIVTEPGGIDRVKEMLQGQIALAVGVNGRDVGQLAETNAEFMEENSLINSIDVDGKQGEHVIKINLRNCALIETSAGIIAFRATEGTGTLDRKMLLDVNQDNHVGGRARALYIYAD